MRWIILPLQQKIVAAGTSGFLHGDELRQSDLILVPA